jgi:hypothetical protein
LVYRRNCYDTLLLGYSQIAATIPTTTTAITSVIEAYITNKKIGKNKDNDNILLRILFRFHVLYCWLFCA